MISLKCDTCEKDFLRSDSDHNRNIRRSTKKFYCSIFCNPASGSDNLGWARILIGNMKKGRATLEDIDEYFLKELYDRQQGLCAITGIPVELKTHEKGRQTPYQISVDRIDNSKNYSKNNVRLTTLIANLARNVFTDQDVLTFCLQVSKQMYLNECTKTFIVETSLN